MQCSKLRRKYSYNLYLHIEFIKDSWQSITGSVIAAYLLVYLTDGLAVREDDAWAAGCFGRLARERDGDRKKRSSTLSGHLAHVSRSISWHVPPRSLGLAPSLLLAFALRWHCRLPAVGISLIPPFTDRYLGRLSVDFACYRDVACTSWATIFDAVTQRT